MRFDSTEAASLNGSQRAAWTALRRRNAQLASPLFSLRLLELVAQERTGVEVAVARQNGQVVGLLPFHRGPAGVARPFAGPLSDLQGAVATCAAPLDTRQMLRSLGLNAWHFHSQLAEQAAFSPHLWRLEELPYIDIAEGFDAYRKKCGARGRRELGEALRKSRKMAREVGPLRFQPHSEDQKVLRQALAWKSDQLARRGAFNALETPWVKRLLSRVVQERGEDFSGLLCSLHAGHTLAAAAVAVRSGAVLHGWVTAFNPQLARYSPGTALLCHLLQAAPQHGIRRVDMGKGPEAYKRRLMTGSIPVAVGSVDRRPLVGTARRQLMKLAQWLGDESPLKRRLHAWLQRRQYLWGGAAQ